MIHQAFICKSNSEEAILDDFVVMDIQVVPKARTAKSPLETGYKTIDNKVIEPRTIRVTGYVRGEFVGIVDRIIERMLNNRKWEFYAVVSKVAAYTDLILVDAPHHEDKEKHDVVEYTLEFEECQMDNAQGMSGDGADSPTQNYGMKG